MNKKGSSLIETMVAMVLLLIITLSSAYFFAIPPFRKEALRFAALERAAGMLELMGVYNKLAGPISGYYKVPDDGTNPSLSDGSLMPLAFYNDMPSMWYTFNASLVTTNVVLPAPSGIREADLKLYDKQGDTNSLFATFKMLLPPAPTP
jgi:hypothetical protein